ncbi:MAG: TetR/AcrR family transcriptional regulator [bacterium]|jgi:AcrR family transcriptional regulator|nr:TetR/AcrR family transcriptional regulator [bacterium]
MVVRKERSGLLTPRDWARAALAAIARGGIAAVAVESVAADLGATKGSFYWHFKNRDALILAALDLWEQRRTESVIEDLDHEPDPAERLRKLLEASFERSTSDRVEIALLANPEHPAATAAVRRVADRRITYIVEQLEKLGWDHGQARDRAVVLYYIYAGHLQMAHLAPEVIGHDARQRQVDLIFGTLIVGQTPASAPPIRTAGKRRDRPPRDAV